MPALRQAQDERVKLFVAGELKKIFAYRKARLAALFPATG